MGHVIKQHAAHVKSFRSGVRLPAFHVVRVPREAVHHNYGRAAPRRLVDRSPQEPQRHGDGHDRAAVEAVRDDAALLRAAGARGAQQLAGRDVRPAELVLQSCALRALARAGPSEAEEHARVRRARSQRRGRGRDRVQKQPPRRTHGGGAVQTDKSRTLEHGETPTRRRCLELPE